MKSRWNPCSPHPEEVDRIVKELGVSPLLAQLLVNRNLSSPEEAYSFLNPSLSELHDPFLMKGMRKVVNRIADAVDKGEKILIYGDYDVDGITSTVVLRRALEMLGGIVDYHIPKRLEDGYGMKKDALRKAWKNGFKLVITVDSGIRDLEACEYGCELGFDIIVTDHHLPDSELPAVYGILNPKQAGCEYPDKDLAAVGVVLKLVQALFERNGRSEVVHHFLKVVAIGTVADMVPLVGENRVIVKFGLDALSQPHNLGLQVLLDGAGVGPCVDNFDVGFKLAPRINAFTRMGGGSEIVDLFSVKDQSAAAAIVNEMNEKNLARRKEEDRILDQVEALLCEPPDITKAPFLLVAGKGWHRGVIGNVAARLVERYYRPVLVLSLGSGRSQGSGRSIPGFHLLEALDGVSDCFEKYGGHAQAVGCTLRPELANREGVEDLRQRLADFARDRLTEEFLIPSVSIDAFLDVQTLSFEIIDDLDRLAPFGIGNPVPVFASRAVGITGGPWVLKDKHLKLRVMGNGQPMDVIWWRRGQVAGDLAPGTSLDLAYSLSRDTYMGVDRLVLTVKDLRIPGAN